MSTFGPVAQPPRPPSVPPPYGSYQPWEQKHNRHVLLPVLGLLALAIPALIVLGFLRSSIGTAPVLVGTTAAVLPVLLVVTTFLWVDRWEPEPSAMLLAAFLWGAGVSVLGAGLVNDTAVLLGDHILGKGGGDKIGALISAPIIEEAFKGAFVLGLAWWRRREFDGVVDGIVYAGLVAAGFAFIENILYFGRAFATDGLVGEAGGVIAVFVLRGVLSPFAHPLFTAMIGIGVGVAVRRRSPTAMVVLPLAGYLAAVLLHAMWNASAGLGLLPFVYFVIMVPLFACLVGLVVWQRRREQRVVTAQLPGFAQVGWIAPSEVPLLASLDGRKEWRAAVRARAGVRAAEAVRHYQDAVTELAFLQDRMQRGAVGLDADRWHQETLAAVLAARERAVRAPFNR
ncbi:MAG TPA: PrsW family intramembrane metalloprotease [Pseudonocardiaceae bacterium]|jgi:RsiW-degrading membrane proteinase PrsW (M82 family)|nr:PrsW family intramembrane metalloprotease [Pseudonocardiaceae bacterium]